MIHPKYRQGGLQPLVMDRGAPQHRGERQLNVKSSEPEGVVRRVAGELTTKSRIG